MQPTKVKELMVPLAEYATVFEDATLNEAILALEEAQKNVEQGREKHRAILVLDNKRRVVGKLTQWDVCAGIEPRYRSIESITEYLPLWTQPGIYPFNADRARTLAKAAGGSLPQSLGDTASKTS